MIAFYSDCKIEKKGKKLIPKLQTCGYKVRKNKNRANRIEWEHVMPAYDFGRQLQCWQDGGRKNCIKTSLKFKAMEGDMHNLVPAVGEINGDRINYKFGMIEGEERKYGAVDFEIDFKGRRVEPRDGVKGDIARIYFYMSDNYRVNLSKSQKKMFQSWAKTDPVDAWEKEKNKRVYAIQGNMNKYIEKIVPPKVDESETPIVSNDGFSCSVQKTCSKMSSCDEAYFHLNTCGNSRLDRDRDGIPCETICKR